MKFISLTTMISMSAAVLADILTDPSGGPCAQPGKLECGTLTGYNDGLPFIFWCLPTTQTIVVLGDCSCPSCCTVIKGGMGPGSYSSCT
ncbi:uncharacterized protein F5147DRAFT_716249 [Suillus discolor]|uniref:Secreted protein n=1 Tax=Suillus discolor TaxID=1912936 RepID=A0A9P7JQ47_9AGAM|nr:uncharacterized protein F5147DRAFT_716249 [Suillus discolor]KAG2096751.1 hypothetical protein F5147DRAFT_716249 [Suillus discolor]